MWKCKFITVFLSHVMRKCATMFPALTELLILLSDIWIMSGKSFTAMVSHICVRKSTKHYKKKFSIEIKFDYYNNNHYGWIETKIVDILTSYHCELFCFRYCHPYGECFISIFWRNVTLFIFRCPLKRSMSIQWSIKLWLADNLQVE